MAANLAVALSTSWKNVVLLDADLRRLSLHNYFDLDNRVGLSSFLKDPNLGNSQIIQETSYERLNIVPRPIPTNPLEMLSSPRMQWLIDHLKETADMVLVYTPPLLAVTDGVILISQLEGVVLVVNGPNCRAKMIRTVTSYLEKVGFSILGYVWKNRKSGEFWNYSEAGRYHRRAEQESLGRSPLEATSLVAESNSLANGSRASQTTPQ